MALEQNSKRCIIADDTRATRELLARWLRACKFDCVMALDGSQAWELVRRQPADLLITDLEMPNLCGLELLDRIRRADKDHIAKLPVLVITSLRDGKTLDVVRSIGGNGLLHKPLEKNSTLSTVLNLIAGKNALNLIHSPDARSVSSKKGVISPTLRQLLTTVASNPLRPEDDQNERAQVD